VLHKLSEARRLTACDTLLSCLRRRMPRCWEKWSLLVVEVVMVITKFDRSFSR
jgi:hypothetical protein